MFRPREKGRTVDQKLLRVRKDLVLTVPPEGRRGEKSLQVRKDLVLTVPPERSEGGKVPAGPEGPGGKGDSETRVLIWRDPDSPLPPSKLGGAFPPCVAPLLRGDSKT